MTNLERLKLYLNKKQYFTDNEYSQFLEECNLDSIEDYDYLNDKKQMLETVYTVLQCLANDIDNFRKVETEFVTTTAAEQYIEKRMQSIRSEIDRIDELEKADGSTNVTGYFFYNS
ncbi:MAG: hypothetical protein IKO36_00540 [Bacteroidaceae bacterium]|nr:hypothetical protein [Bacteroidaceae bacterium]